MTRFLALPILAGLMAVARWAPIEELTHLGYQATLSLGFILIFGYLTGHFFRQLSLPGITGYIVAGILCGPFVGRFLTSSVVEGLQLIDDLALALIAFSAGGELRLKSIRPRLRSILAINFFQTLVIFLGMAGVVLALSATPLLEIPGVPILAVALVFGVLGVANSPATGVAVIKETRARGLVTDTILGVTVLKDVVVLVLITILLPFIRLLSSPGSGFDLNFIGDLSLEVGGSIVGGLGLGILVTLYMRGVGAVLPLFIIGVSILVTQVSRQFHLEPLLLCMVAGFVIENVTRMGDRFIDAIGKSALPVYVVFFAIGGASLDLGALSSTWPLALILVGARIVFIALSTSLGERISRGGNLLIERRGWMGFIAQAGVTLGLASIVARKFPEWGPHIQTIALAMIAVNQLIGPIALRWVLIRSGEAGKAAPASPSGTV